MIYDDDDTPEFTDEVMARARPAREVLPPEVMAAFKRGRGRPVAAEPKTQVTIRLSPRVLSFYRDSGPGWQTRINDALEAVVDAGQEAADRRV